MAFAKLETDTPRQHLKRRDYGAFGVTPISPHIGAEIEGLDLAKLDAAQMEAIHQAWADWMVLVFRDQTLDREAHKALGRHFGELHVHPAHRGNPDTDPEVLVVKTTAESAYTAGEAWHSDVTCDDIPPMGSMLYITETPECGGGDTLFANMYLAYEMLSPAMQAFLDDKIAIHDGGMPYRDTYGITPPKGGFPKAEHPVVVSHPVTGQKLLYVNSGFTSLIKGLAPRESRAILDLLFGLLNQQPKLHCRVHWRPGTLTLWDNRCTQHQAVWDYYPFSRYGERVSFLGKERPRR